MQKIWIIVKTFAVMTTETIIQNAEKQTLSYWFSGIRLRLGGTEWTESRRGHGPHFPLTWSRGVVFSCELWEDCRFHRTIQLGCFFKPLIQWVLMEKCKTNKNGYTAPLWSQCQPYNAQVHFPWFRLVSLELPSVLLALSWSKLE